LGHTRNAQRKDEELGVKREKVDEGNGKKKVFKTFEMIPKEVSKMKRRPNWKNQKRELQKKKRKGVATSARKKKKEGTNGWIAPTNSEESK